MVYLDDSDKQNQENLAINHDNIVFRGFGDAIRLKYPLVGNRDFVSLRANRRKLRIPFSCEEYTYKQVKLLCG